MKARILPTLKKENVSSFFSLYSACIFLLLVASPTLTAQAQKVAKYGAEFLAGGVGGRSLGMGGTHVGIANDVTATYWNAAGLSAINYPQISYMHSERFAGEISFDYAGAAFPISKSSTIGVTIIRSGVDDIPVTLNAWDIERNQPKPNPENFIERISAADYAFMVSYARMLKNNLTMGITGKVVRRTIGDFADAWGYSFDLGMQWSPGHWQFGVNVQDVSTMLQSWSVNSAELAQLEDFGQALPEGGTLIVLPVLRMGAGYHMPFAGSHLLLAADLDVAFDGQQAYVLNVGDASFHPRIGAEYVFMNAVALRAGIRRVLVSDDLGGIDVTPDVGLGLRLNQFTFDYGFGDFAGVSSDLGFSHRISARLILQQPRLQRSAR